MGKTRGASKIFSAQEINQLGRNPNVLRVSETTITYSPAFKVAAVQAYLTGQPPMEIFLEAGFHLDAIGHDKPKKCLLRWRQVFAAQSEEGLLEVMRAKQATGRRNAGERSVEDKLRRAEARIKLLEAENELLKKLEALERQANKVLTPSERFELINQIISKHDLHSVTRYLSQVVEVSTSGYYR